MKIIIALLFLLVSHSLLAQVPAGNRIAAYQIDMSQNNNYDSAFSYANHACMKSVHLALAWDQMEPTPNNIGGSTYALLPIINIYYPAFGASVELQIPVINTVARGVPTDLANTSFNSPTMIRRFKILLDSIFHNIPNVTLSALNIGNESDAYFGSNAAAYADFKTFLDSIAPYAKAKYLQLHAASLNVGTTFTWNGLTNAGTKALCKSVNQGRDIVAVTYYPLALNYQVKNPSVIASEFDQLVSEYPNASQPIYFVECGYPSSTSCGSSLALQSQFIQKVFAAWDTYASNIKYITFFKTTDWSQGAVDTLAVYYGLAQDTAFKEYLRTLGLRTYPGNGTNKPAYDTLLCQLDRRGFCATSCAASGIDESFPNPIGVTLSPNPFKETATVEIVMGSNENYSLTIYDLFGREVGRYAITKAKTEVARGTLPTGMYVYKVKDHGQTIAGGKMIIE